MKKFTLLMLLCATPAFGQEIMPVTPIVEVMPTPSLRTPIAVYTASAVFDWTSTYAVLDVGFRDKNLIPSLTDNRPAATVALTALADVGTVLAVRKLLKRHPKLAQTTLYVLSGVKIASAAGKYRQYRRWKAVQ